MAKRLKTEEYAGMPIYFGKDAYWVWAYAGKQNEFDGKFEYRAEAPTKELAFKKIKSRIDAGREKIVLERKNSKTHYSLTSDYTTYASFPKAQYLFVDVARLKKRRNKIVRELRDSGVTVRTSTNDELLREESDAFVTALAEYERIQERAIQAFDAIYEMGLYAPTVDNDELDSATELVWKLDNMRNRDQPISRIRELESRVDEIASGITRYKQMEEVSV